MRTGWVRTASLDRQSGSLVRCPQLVSRRAVLGLVVVSALVLAPPAAATPQFLYQFGSSGQNPGEFTNPQGVALDPSLGVVYVVDGTRVEKFDYQGHFLLQWGSYDLFQAASWIAVDPSSHDVYLVANGNGANKVLIFDPSGNFLGQFGSSGADNGQFTQAAGIAINPSTHNVFVADAIPGQGRVEEFSPSGTYLYQFGVAGTPNDMAIDPATGNIYVVVGSNQVQVYNSLGIFIGAFGTNQLGMAKGIAIDPYTRDVYVADDSTYTVDQFNIDGQFLSEFGGFGSGAGQFEGPFGVAADPTYGLIYVADASGARVEIWYQPHPPPPPGGGGGTPHCVVPRLVGKRLTAARQALAAAHCALGRVRHRHTKRAHRGRVVSQSERAGTRLAAGAKVGVVVGR